MGLSPALTLVALAAFSLFMVIGMSVAPDSAERIFGMLSPIIGILILILRQDYLAYKLSRENAAKAEEVKRVTEEAAAKAVADAKATAAREAELMRLTVASSNAVRTNEIATLNEKMETVVKQTNGHLSETLKGISESIAQVSHQTNSMKDELVQAVLDVSALKETAAFAAGVKSETDKK